MNASIAKRVFKDSKISTDRVISMLNHMDPQEIASDLGVDWKTLRAMLVKDGKLPKTKWAGVNNRTGAVVRGFNERGVYLRAQILGWTDWAFIDASSMPDVV